MDPLTLMLIQSGLGAAQVLAGTAGAMGNKQPVYTIPKEYNSNLSEASMRAAGGLPSASKQLASDQMARTTAAGLSKLVSRNSLGAGLSGLAQAQADQANKLAAMDAQARLNAERDVANARMAIANAKDKEFAIKNQNYLQRAQANSALLGSGIQNAFNAMQSYGMMDMLGQYYGGGQEEPTSNNMSNMPIALQNFFTNFKLR